MLQLHFIILIRRVNNDLNASQQCGAFCLTHSFAFGMVGVVLFKEVEMTVRQNELLDKVLEFIAASRSPDLHFAADRRMWVEDAKMLLERVISTL